MFNSGDTDAKIAMIHKVNKERRAISKETCSMAHGAPVESGMQLVARLNHRSSLQGLDNVLFPNTLEGGEIVEISGNVSSGKTLFLTQLLAKCILPSENRGVIVGGLDVGAILVNTDHHFCVSKLSRFMYDAIISSFVSSNESPPHDELMTDIIRTSLENLLVVNCYNSCQFRLALTSLENLMLEQENAAVIMLDSISAFYWEERETLGSWNKKVYVDNLLRIMHKCTSDFNVPLIFTKPSDFVFKKKNSATVLEHVDHRIKLSRIDDSDKFRCTIDSKDCKNQSRAYQINSSGVKWLDLG